MKKEEIKELDAILAAHHANGSQLQWDHYKPETPGLTKDNMPNYRNRLVALNLISIVRPPTQLMPSGETQCITSLTDIGCLTTSVAKFIKNKKTLHSGAVSKAWQEKYWWVVAILSFLIGATLNHFLNK